MSKNLSELSGRKGLEVNLFEELGIASRQTGTPSSKDLERIADEFLIGKSITYGTATFYDFMKPENQNKKVYICNGTACVCSGKQDAVQTILEKHVDASEIGHMTCLGRCHENGAFNYQGKNYSAKTEEEIAEIL
jgi:NADH-quinone oxidoreductase subunit F